MSQLDMNKVEICQFYPVLEEKEDRCSHENVLMLMDI